MNEYIFIIAQEYNSKFYFCKALLSFYLAYSVASSNLIERSFELPSTPIVTP